MLSIYSTYTLRITKNVPALLLPQTCLMIQYCINSNTFMDKLKSSSIFVPSCRGFILKYFQLQSSPLAGRQAEWRLLSITKTVDSTVKRTCHVKQLNNNIVKLRLNRLTCNRQNCVYFNGVKCLFIRSDLAMHRLTWTTPEKVIGTPYFESRNLGGLDAQALLNGTGALEKPKQINCSRI